MHGKYDLTVVGQRERHLTNEMYPHDKLVMSHSA